MKVKYFGIVILLLFFLNNNGQCTHCENTTDNGINSSAIGKGTQATGQTSFASGAFSIAPSTRPRLSVAVTRMQEQKTS